MEDIIDIYENAESSAAVDDLDLDFIIESIKEQCTDLMESSSKRNYLKLFENKINPYIQDFAVKCRIYAQD